MVSPRSLHQRYWILGAWNGCDAIPVLHRQHLAYTHCVHFMDLSAKTSLQQEIRRLQTQMFQDRERKIHPIYTWVITVITPVTNHLRSVGWSSKWGWPGVTCRGGDHQVLREDRCTAVDSFRGPVVQHTETSGDWWLRWGRWGSTGSWYTTLIQYIWYTYRIDWIDTGLNFDFTGLCEQTSNPWRRLVTCDGSMLFQGYPVSSSPWANLDR